MLMESAITGIGTNSLGASYTAKSDTALVFFWSFVLVFCRFCRFVALYGVETTNHRNNYGNVIIASNGLVVNGLRPQKIR